MTSPTSLRVFAGWLTALCGPLALAFVCTAQTPPATLPVATSAQAEYFEKNVRPLLATQCISCHGPELQLGGVRLDSPEEVRKTLTPGAPENSRLIRVLHYNGKIKMPPDGKRPDGEILTLTQWVKAGAPWPAAAPKVGANTGNAKSGPTQSNHWAFQPVRRVAPPSVKNKAWGMSPVDRFVLARLEAQNLAPAPPASKRALLRRAYFDVLGLPPTPEQIEAFVQDRAPGAWGRAVDRLLASPQYGERWARHWLDVARYADSNGLDENKAFAYAWRYRDWVVSALNRDLPYDEFLRDQIAGDLLDSGDDEVLRNERVTATGFLTLGAKVLAEQDKPKLVMDIVDEQIDVTTKATMGLTVACARCHDHKFDPISTKDYYALAGIFKSTKTMRNLAFVSEWNERELHTKALDAAIIAHKESLKPLESALMQAQTTANEELRASIRRDAPKYLLAGAELARQPGFLVSLAESTAAPGDNRQTIEAVSFVRGNAIRDTQNYGKGLGVIITDAPPVSAEWDVTVPATGRYQIEVRYAAEESRPVQLLLNGKLVNKAVAGGMTGTWMPDTQQWEVVGVYDLNAGKNVLRIERNDGPFPHISRLFLTSARTDIAPTGSKPLTAADVAKKYDLIPEIVTRWAGRTWATLTDADKARLLTDSSLLALPKKAEAFYTEAGKSAVKKAQDALDAARKSGPQVPVVMAVADEMKGEDVRVHLRGNTQTLGDVAPRGFPVVLARICAPDDTAPITSQNSGRLALARWLTRPNHPLTARVQVNRVWQHLFGEGLVRTPDNWGVKGEKPTHPELLDYLAATFTDSRAKGGDNWSQKRLIRRLMLTNAYQMATVSPLANRAAQTDPENRLLWRQNRRRLEAEPLRDAVLSVAGTLDTHLGGSLLTTADNDYVTNDQSKDQALYDAPRRALYLPVVRNSVYDLFQAFDFGDGTTVNAHRASTTVAPQALFLLNSPLVREAAGAFARSLLTGPNANTPDNLRIRRAYYRAFARPANDGEVSQALTYVSRYQNALASTEPDGSKRRERAWQSLCQALLASNEFIYLE